MSETIHRAGFGGGIVRAGSPDQGRDDELEQCDEYDIGARGELLPTRTVTNYTTVKDKQGAPAVFGDIYGVGFNEFGTGIDVFLVGNGTFPLEVPSGQLALARLDPSTEGATVAAASVLPMGLHLTPDHPLVTFLPFPYVKGGAQIRPILVNVGHRVGASAVSLGLFVMTFEAGAYVLRAIGAYDALGTGNNGETFPGGTLAVQLYFRGIAGYNNHVFAWGGGSAPNRITFSNLANPFKWGNDNLASSGNRSFSDTDAIVLGGAGEIITAGVNHNKRLWVATNRGLHFIEGYGRASFLADGAQGVRKSLDVVGVHAMLEGGDGALYGVGKRGLWRMGADGIEHVYRKLVDYADRSVGYWNLMWVDSARAAGMPGKSNMDLVWLMDYPEAKQVWCVIPYCNAAAGYGYGTDTVILKYHTDTGGFTRQVFPGQVLMHGAYIPASTATPERTVVVLGNGAAQNVKHFGKRSGAITTSPPFSSSTVFQTIDHAQFGANGVGVYRKAYLTIAWESDAVPIALQVSVYVDGELVDTRKLYVRASGAADGVSIDNAADGELWLDTAGTDANIGTGTAGSLIPASADYVLRVRRGGSWWNLPFAGQKNRRATVPIAFVPKRGSRISIKVEGGVASPTGAGTSAVIATVGRYSIEGLGNKPSPISGAQ